MPKIEDDSFLLSVTGSKGSNNRTVVEMVKDGAVYTALQCLFGEDLENIRVATSVSHTPGAKGIVGVIRAADENEPGGHVHKGHKPGTVRVDRRTPIRDALGQFNTISRIKASWIEDREDGLYFGIDYADTKPAIRRPRKIGHKRPNQTGRRKLVAGTPVPLQPGKPIPPMLEFMSAPLVKVGDKIGIIVDLRNALRDKIAEFNAQGGDQINCNLELKLTKLEETLL